MRPLLVLIAAFAACNRISDEPQIERTSSSTTEAPDAASVAGLLDAALEAGGDTLGMTAEFEKARADYGRAKAQDLAAIDKRIADVEVKTLGKKGTSKADYEVSLVKIRERRAQLALDIRGIAGTSPRAWDDMTQKVDIQTRELRKLIDQAPATMLLLP